MSIRNRKISNVRLDKSNVDAPTINRALDTIINAFNPWVDDATQTINALQQQVDDLSVGSGVQINPEGASSIAGSNLTFSGSGGISFSSNGSDTLVINQQQVTIAAQGTAGSGTGNALVFSGSGGATITRSGTTLTINQGAPSPQSITFDVSGSNTISGSSFQLSGANGIVLTGTAPNTLIIDASGVPPTGPAGGVLGYAGSTYPNPNGLAASVAGGGIVSDKIPIKQGTLGVKIKYDTFSEAQASNRVFQIEGADAFSFPNPLAGGEIIIQGGKGNTQPVVNNGAGGEAALLGGEAAGSAAGGQARVQGGYSANGAGGDTYIRGGNPNAGQNGGDVFIIGGENFFQNAVGGDITLRAGDGTTDGVINIGLTTTSKVNIGAASIPTEVYGSLTGSVISASTNIIAPAITGSAISSSNFIGWANGTIKPYGYFFNSGSLTASATNTAFTATLPNLGESLGVSVSNNSRINFSYAGTYNIQFSAQASKGAGSSIQELYLWFQETGSNIANSAFHQHIKDSNANAVIAGNFLRTLASGSYIEMLYQTTDTDISLKGQPAAGNIPAIPSLIITVSQV